MNETYDPRKVRKVVAEAWIFHGTTAKLRIAQAICPRRILGTEVSLVYMRERRVTNLKYLGNKPVKSDPTGKQFEARLVAATAII